MPFERNALTVLVDREGRIAISHAFMGYQPNSTAVQMQSIDKWRVKDGKLIEHWDELNLLEVFQQIGEATVRKAEGQ